LGIPKIKFIIIIITIIIIIGDTWCVSVKKSLKFIFLVILGGYHPSTGCNGKETQPSLFYKERNNSTGESALQIH
jgi:hypothetical protein